MWIRDALAGAQPLLLRYWIRYRIEILLALAALVGPLVVWQPYRHDMSLVYRFWDGPSYLTIARNLYGVHPGDPLVENPNEPPFYLCHYPLYPVTVRLLSVFGWERALLLSVLLATIAGAILFYRLARDVWGLRSPAFLTLVFLYFPPRFVLYRSVGASEPLFLAMILASFWSFEKSRYWWAAAFAGLASITRLQGLAFLPAYAVLLLSRGRRRELRSFVLIPAGVILYFAYSSYRYGDFWAPLAPHLGMASSSFPFSIIRNPGSWTVHYWAETYILLVTVLAVGIWRIRRFPVPFWYCVFQFLGYVYLAEGDMNRYALAVVPFALIVGYREIFDSRAFRFVFPVVVLLSLRWARRGIPLNGDTHYAELLRYLRLKS